MSAERMRSAPLDTKTQPPGLGVAGDPTPRGQTHPRSDFLHCSVERTQGMQTSARYTHQLHTKLANSILLLHQNKSGVNQPVSKRQIFQIAMSTRRK